MPRSITIPDVDDATATWLTEEAGRRGVSVEMVASLLLRRGLEWERHRAELPIYHDLDALAGTWSEDEAVTLDTSTRSPVCMSAGGWTIFSSERQDQ